MRFIVGERLEPGDYVQIDESTGKLVKATPPNVDEFYWLNEVNMVESGGPFPTLDEAKRDAVRVSKHIGDEFRSILLLKKVGGGSVTPNYKWKDDE